MREPDYRYKTEKFKKSMAVTELLNDYVDVPKFLRFCKECGNYNKVWSCPEYDFNPMDIWNKHEAIDITIQKIFYNDLRMNSELSEENLKGAARRIMFTEKKKLMDELLLEEKKHPGSLSLSAGSCDLCRIDVDSEDNNCAKTCGEPCRHPSELRYSIESLGGDVIKIAEDLFDTTVLWSKGYNLPEYHILMCGLLK